MPTAPPLQARPVTLLTVSCLESFRAACRGGAHVLSCDRCGCQIGVWVTQIASLPGTEPRGTLPYAKPQMRSQSAWGWLLASPGALLAWGPAPKLALAGRVDCLELKVAGPWARLLRCSPPSLGPGFSSHDHMRASALGLRLCDQACCTSCVLRQLRSDGPESLRLRVSAGPTAMPSVSSASE